jgi:flagella basal body P-ring formation protein FlgA
MNHPAPRRRIGQPIGRFLAVLLLIASLPAFNASASFVGMDGDENSKAAVTLRSEVAIASNVLRLRDICDMTQSNDVAQALQDIPLGPTPRAGITQSWTRNDIAKVLALRGMDPESIRWSGSDAVQISRTESTIQANTVAMASAVAPVLSDKSKINQQHDFAPAFTTPVSITQAERVVASAIESYLQLKTGAQGKWRIKPSIPPQHANALMQRRQIVSVAGGKEPWEGSQKFAILMRTPDGESVVEIEADVRLPMMVVAAKGPIARGRVLQDSDLVWLALSPASKISPDECFCDFESLVGKQLRKAVSTQQPIRIQDVGDPFLVQAGDSVTIAVLAGSVRVEAYGRAIESGAIDEMIQVEVLPQKKRVAARVTAERRVEVIAAP